MAFILNIDTALDTACISLTEDRRPLLSAFNESRKDHAGWIQNAIHKLMVDAGLNMKELNAVGVNVGPGSYTGLRIGLSTAKGLCYALHIPLITAVSLEIIGLSAIKHLENSFPGISELLFCPMIDAGRMEVFTSVYDSKLRVIIKPRAFILDSNSFKELLKRQKILFLGNGSIKFQQICQNQNAMFEKIPLNPFAIAALTYKNFIGNNFADPAYAEPLYLKEFFIR